MRQNLTFYLKQEGEEQKSFDKELMEMFQDLSSDDQESSADEVNFVLHLYSLSQSLTLRNFLSIHILRDFIYTCHLIAFKKKG